MLTPLLGSISFMECVGKAGHIWLIPPGTYLFYGEVSECFKESILKIDIPLKGIVGWNPTLTASFKY